MTFYRSGDAVCADIILQKVHEGWQNMAHGGIVSTLLDEVMAWTILYFKRVFFVTRRMEVKYSKPVLIGVPLTVQGRLMQGKREPFIGVEAKIVDGEGQVLTRASGDFVQLPPERLSSVPVGMKQDMVELFGKFDAAK